MNKKSARIAAKTLALILVIVLAVGSVVGGTVAWLITKTEPVVNTFTYGDINIDLEESGMKPAEGGEGFTNEYEMIPGSKIKKDPVVTVKAGSEACYLFVKLEENGGVDPYTFDDYLTYEVDGKWTALDGVEGVYYIEVDVIQEDGVDAEYPVLKAVDEEGNTLTVKDTVTKEMLNALDEGGASNYPTLTITAYAVQMENIESAAAAWGLVMDEYIDPPASEPATESTAAANP